MGTVPNILTIEQVVKLHIINTLQVLGGNKTEAARLLGIDRRTLYRKLRKEARGKGR